MNKSIKDLKQIIEYVKENGVKIKRILVPRIVLNDVRIGMLSLGLDPRDFYDPNIEARNLRLMDTLLVEDLSVDEIHAEVERA